MSQVENALIKLRGQEIILDSKVAELYGVETREVNQAVKNNPEKFPDGYVLTLDSDELADLRSKFLIANLSPKSRVLPKAFTEKGLYMLATILKSPRATQTTLAVVETFAKIRELSRTVRNWLKPRKSSSKDPLCNGAEKYSPTLWMMICPSAIPRHPLS